MSKPWCDSTMLSNISLLGGRWSYTSQDGFVYEPSYCRLRRLSAERARKCLVGRHLMMLGDSTQRYLYLTLAQYLSSGTWERDETLLGKNESICHELTYARPGRARRSYSDAWQAYFSATNARIRGHGSEICDCYRVSCCSEDSMTENRFTQLTGGGVVSFVNQMMSHSWRLHGHLGPSSDWATLRDDLRCAPGACSGPSRWAEDLQNFTRSVLPNFGVTDLLLNWAHHWSSDMAPLGVIDNAFASASAAMRPGGSGAWWRTATILKHGVRTLNPKPFGRSLEQPLDRRAARRHGLGLVDVLGITMQLRELPREIYQMAFTQYDDFHFACSVNRELNYVIMHAVCATDRSSAESSPEAARAAPAPAASATGGEMSAASSETEEPGRVRLAMLIPSYGPHLPLLARLVNQTIRLAKDIHRVHIYALLSFDEEVSNFRDGFPAESGVLRFMVFTDALLQVANLTVAELSRHGEIPAVKHRPDNSLPRCRKSRVWTADRQTSGVKKWVGLLMLHRQGYTHTWVVDSDSLPLKPFSFAPMFAEFAARPRLLVANLTHPSIPEIGSGVIEHLECASRALQLTRPPKLSYYINDYWMYALEDVAAMARRIETRSRQPFLLTYMQYPASEYVYYGMYTHHLAPRDRRHEVIVLPEAILNDPLVASVWHAWRWDYFRGVWCEHKPATIEKKLRLLDGPILSWVHGYRFDYVHTACRKHAGAIVLQSAAVTWATSNFRDKFLTFG